MKTVLVAGSIHNSGMELLSTRRDLQVNLLSNPTVEQIMQAIGDADALLVRTTPITREAISRAKKLKIVSRHGVGYDNIDIDALTEYGIPLTVIGDINSTSVAEHAIFLMIALAKCGLRLDHAVRAGNWTERDQFAAIELRGKTLLLIGFGRIGSKVAELARAFGMRILVYDPYVKREQLDQSGCGQVSDWRDALGTSDFVSLHLPLSTESKEMIGREELARMKPGSFLINTARGGLIDQSALYDCLRDRKISGAALDAFETEPLPAGHDLCKLDNIILTPHSAALTQECARLMAVVSAQNVLDGLDGNLDRNLVINQTILS
jgi:D-3-phosphoglycerate dehydrogenase / 2-oxoglutarate reductase